MADQVCLLKNISKSFDGVPVLHDITLDLKKGEIHAIIGDNRGGKSVLMSVLSGSLPFDSGEIYINGTKIHSNSASGFRKAGISYLCHDSILVPEMSVQENLLLGNYPVSPLTKTLDHAAARQRARQVMESINFSVDLQRKVHTFGIAEQRIIELAKCLCSESSILILDELAVGLNDEETKYFYEQLLLLRRHGVSIFLISHNLKNVMEVADRITLLHKGAVSWTIENGKENEDEICRRMSLSMSRKGYAKLHGKHREESLRVCNLSNGTILHDISFSLGKGEVIGIIGPAGSGRTTLARCLFGLDKTRTGDIYINGEPVCIHSPEDAIALKMGLIEEVADRSLVPEMNAIENMTLNNLSGRSGIRTIDFKLEKYSAMYFLEKLGFDKKSSGVPVKKLSKGEKQLVLIAKWLFSNTRILIVDEGTVGLDAAAKVSISSLLSEYSSKGVSILLLSTDVQELVGVCDRVFVMHNGTFAYECAGEAMTVEAVIKNMEKSS